MITTKKIKQNLLWIIYFSFVAFIIIMKSEEPLFISNGPYPFGKYIAWLLYFSFLGYSLYCSSKESFFKSLKKLSSILWARQIGIDLYIGLAITFFLIYLNEGSLIVLGIWFLPILIYANLATLLYIAMNYDSLIGHFF